MRGERSVCFDIEITGELLGCFYPDAVNGRQGEPLFFRWKDAGLSENGAFLLHDSSGEAVGYTAQELKLEYRGTGEIEFSPEREDRLAITLTEESGDLKGGRCARMVLRKGYPER
jgi:hypothetical protein